MSRQSFYRRSLCAEDVDAIDAISSLTFADEFNKRLDGVTLPGGLEDLTFGRDFNQLLEEVLLPKTLQTLTFGSQFNQSLEEVMLPRSRCEVSWHGKFFIALP